MFHIIATIVALTSIPPLAYRKVPVFDTKAACEDYLAGDEYKTEVEALKAQVKIAADVDSDIISVCVEIEQPEK